MDSDPAWNRSSNPQEIYQCRMYSRKLLMMGKGNARNVLFFDRIKFGKFVRLVGIIAKKFVSMQRGHVDVKLWRGFCLSSWEP
jgi:hypothetical protein